jgi:hypothetical protein
VGEGGEQNHNYIKINQLLKKRLKIPDELSCLDTQNGKYMSPYTIISVSLLKIIKESYGSENYLTLTYGNNVLCNATYNYFIGVNTLSINNINIILNI